jgi:chorismate--pyruvate lyase
MFHRPKPPVCVLREARWTPLLSRRLPGVPPQRHAWLRDPGSLTRSIQQTCGAGRFGVDLVSQRHGPALPSEARLLDAGPAPAMLVREVRLNCGHKTWVFARTLMPMSGLDGGLAALTRLGRRPLGEVLFSDPTTRRRCIEVACIGPRHHLFAPATAHLRRPPAVLWGRRTLFDYRGSPILVNELFLPEIPALARRETA